MFRLVRASFGIVLALSVLGNLSAQEKAAAKGKGPVIPAARIKAPKGFQVDLLYSVPKDTQGSWVNMTVDPKGRLIVSDQYGALYRVSLPPVTAKPEELKPESLGIEAIDAPIGEAQGLLWAFDSLYVVVNRGKSYDSGLYRVTDSNGDDKLDKVELLRKIEGNGEHGPHAVVLAPDGKSLYVVAGNSTKVPDVEKSLVPRVWGEDNLLPRMVDGSGFMTTEKAPGGYVCRVTPDGKSWDLVAMGFRNSFDLAFNRSGELFTYDSDMEWDVNTPWYRPTRVLHVTSGGDYGYRNGAGKWPPYYIDSLPPVVNVGPGSPTGISFGNGAKFPAKYQNALYLCDWSYGKLYALHMKPDGASYAGELEEFVVGTPLALTDVVINPADGAMYFAVGGRKTQSGLYRVTYSGSDSVAPANVTDAGATAEARKLRHELEGYHGRQDPKAIDAAWPHLGSKDRFIRWAARVAVQSQPTEKWHSKAIGEKSSSSASLNALLAAIQSNAQDPAHRKPSDAAPSAAVRDEIVKAMESIALDRLTYDERLDLVRLYQIVLNRFGGIGDDAKGRVIERLMKAFPAKGREMNVEIAQVLAFFQVPNAVAKLVSLLDQAPTQEEQIEYARALRVMKSGWTPALQEKYFAWFVKAASYKGGNSFPGFMANIKRDAEANLSDEQKVALKPLLEAKPPADDVALTASTRPVVKMWNLDELVPLVESGLKDRDFDHGRKMFAIAKCFACHRFNNEGGGLGPDLSGVAGRFSTRDLLESVILPNKVVSDQYQTVIIHTVDGKSVTGRIVNLNDDTIMVNTDMFAPNKMQSIKRGDIDQLTPSPVSMMPEGLLNTLNQDEALDLVAYLLSRGNRENAMFRGGQ